jgi:hypothetical protein
MGLHLQGRRIYVLYKYQWQMYYNDLHNTVHSMISQNYLSALGLHQSPGYHVVPRHSRKMPALTALYAEPLLQCCCSQIALILRINDQNLRLGFKTKTFPQGKRSHSASGRKQGWRGHQRRALGVRGHETTKQFSQKPKVLVH